MNDRELLELAAKAAGIERLFWSEIHDTFFYSGMYDSGSEFQPDAVWNPLTDDGDALRLAVKLDLLVDCARPLPDSVEWQEASDPDDYAATRRAIVRAAAEIGKEMK